MRNTDILTKKIDKAIQVLEQQDKKLEPVMDMIQQLLVNKLQEADIPFQTLLEMWVKVQEQYTNSILLLTKLKEIVDFKE